MIIIVQPGKALRQPVAAVEIRAEGDVPLAVQLQKMIEMAAQIVKRRAGRLRQKRRVEVQPRRAAEIADGLELLVRQIARVGRRKKNRNGSR